MACVLDIEKRARISIGPLTVGIGCSTRLWMLIFSVLIPVLVGAPWWVPLGCAVVLLSGGVLSVLVAGVLVYFAWGAWWAVIPLGALAASTALRILYQPQRLRERGMRWYAAYQQSYSRVHLRRAVVRLQRAAVLAVPEDPNRPLYMINYAASLVSLHELEDMPEALEEAERVCRETLDSLPSDHPKRVGCLVCLSSVLSSQYKRDDKSVSPEEIVRTTREAVAASRDDLEKSVVLANMGTALLMLYQRTGSEEALWEGVQANRDAVTAAQNASQDTCGVLANLSGALLIAYSVNGELATLEEAVQASRQAIATAPPGIAIVDAWAAGLAQALLVLFERTRRPELLDEAADLARSALDHWPPDHPELGDFINTFGRVLMFAAEHGDRPELADKAVRALDEAVALLPKGHVKRTHFLEDLCAALTTSFVAHGRPEDLLEAVAAGREAVSLTSHDDTRRGMLLLRLGRALEAQYDHTDDPGDLAEACRNYATAAELTSESVFVRAGAARRAAEAYIRARDYGAAWAMAELAAGLIPRIAPQRLGLDDRLHVATAGLRGLAATAAEAAIGLGDPGLAVELLEQTKGVVLGGTFAMRGDFAELRSRAPDLAGELDDLVRAIERTDPGPLPGMRSDRASDPEALSELRTRLNRQWDELLARIRKHPGLRDFLALPPIDRLCGQAAEGPIVYVMAHREHGNALIVTDDPGEPVVAVDLPLLTQEAVKEQVAALHHAQQCATTPGAVTRRRQAQRDMLRILEWLWHAAAAPILNALALTSPPADGRPWPRIWWCPVGPCGFLPLHAAGRHADGGHDTVMDRVVSSYTTTVRALAHARRSQPGTCRTPSTLIVSVPDAPGTAPLSGATAEADLLTRLPLNPTLLHSPDRAAVLAALPDHEIAHFACHGVADTRVPTDSRLLLHDHLDEPLTVSAIGRLRMDHGELAYLSACSTTGTTERHADEAVHVTAAFQLLGYRRVVGTLWPVNDRAAVSIAENFYTNLTHSGTTPNPTAAATALHHAVRAHRARYPALPTQWASHIHHGS